MRWIVSALVLAAFAGPVPAATALPPATAAQKLRTQPNATDGQILTAIRAKLAKSKVASDRFTVTVQNRIATFEGRTSVIQHKGVATRIARTSGAVAVQNHIQISDDAKAQAVARLKRSESAPVPGKPASAQPATLTRATVIPSGK